ncbi:MAG: chemotaxis protein CheW [Actinomycetia bacterium]|nr:chemotaxis protein CheW [Actinomycetes bacterium]MCP4087149.1 chemotaxis protein CheW [Actinomycetes bacterium]
MTTTTGLQLCTFRLDQLYLGIDVLDVQEVLYHADVTAVPHAAPAIRGLINLRGQIATTVDLRSRLDLPANNDPDARPIHVVVRTGGESVSLIVDFIGDVLEIDPNLYEPPPETMTGIARTLIMGAYKLDGELLLVLDVAKAVNVRSQSMEVAT